MRQLSQKGVAPPAMIYSLRYVAVEIAIWAFCETEWPMNIDGQVPRFRLCGLMR